MKRMLTTIFIFVAFGCVKKNTVVPVVPPKGYSIVGNWTESINHYGFNGKTDKSYPYTFGLVQHYNFAFNGTLVQTETVNGSENIFPEYNGVYSQSIGTDGYPTLTINKTSLFNYTWALSEVGGVEEPVQTAGLTPTTEIWVVELLNDTSLTLKRIGTLEGVNPQDNATFLQVYKRDKNY